jgi:hypothetical protein
MLDLIIKLFIVMKPVLSSTTKTLYSTLIPKVNPETGVKYTYGEIVDLIPAESIVEVSSGRHWEFAPQASGDTYQKDGVTHELQGDRFQLRSYNGIDPLNVDGALA